MKHDRDIALIKYMRRRVPVFDRAQQQLDQHHETAWMIGRSVAYNIVTGHPPAFKQSARAAWQQARDEAAIMRDLGWTG